MPVRSSSTVLAPGAMDLETITSRVPPRHTSSLASSALSGTTQDTLMSTELSGSVS